jgi:branched-chain amino acid transport system permease protein
LSAYTVFGILLIVLMYLMPMGIAGGVYALIRSFRRGAPASAERSAPAATRKPAAQAGKSH